MRLISALICATLSTGVAAQMPGVPRPPAPAPRTESNPEVRETLQRAIVIGCLRDDRLKFSPDVGTNRAVATLGARDLKIEGPKELIRRLKLEHNDHEDELTGVIIIPPADTRDRVIETRRVGPKTTVTTTGRQRSTEAYEPVEQPRTLRFKVESLKHVSDRCSVATR